MSFDTDRLGDSKTHYIAMHVCCEHKSATKQIEWLTVNNFVSPQGKYTHWFGFYCLDSCDTACTGFNHNMTFDSNHYKKKERRVLKTSSVVLHWKLQAVQSRSDGSHQSMWQRHAWNSSISDTDVIGERSISWYRTDMFYCINTPWVISPRWSRATARLRGYCSAGAALTFTCGQGSAELLFMFPLGATGVAKRPSGRRYR